MTNLFRHVPALVIGTIIGVGLLFIRGCFKDHKAPSFMAPLTEETLAQIAMEDHHIAIRTHRDTQAAYVPDAGRVTANVDKEGKIILDVQNKGFTFKPVMGLMVSTDLRGALGAQVGYWNRFELYVGGGFPKPVAFVGFGYRLDQISFLQNTSLALTYDSKKQIGLVGLLRF